jgi:MerR family transcriptional regulator/heat shock protein HspR
MSRAPTSGSGCVATPDRFEDAARAVFVISVAAELAGVHPQTLRIYERKGLVDPSRTVGGSRRYSRVDIDKVRRIQDLTAAGLNLEGVRRVMALEEEMRELRDELARVQEIVRDAVAQVHRQYRRDLVPLSMSPVVWGRDQRAEDLRGGKRGA